jgi:hypothetical protein
VLLKPELFFIFEALQIFVCSHPPNEIRLKLAAQKVHSEQDPLVIDIEDLEHLDLVCLQQFYIGVIDSRFLSHGFIQIYEILTRDRQASDEEVRLQKKIHWSIGWHQNPNFLHPTGRDETNLRCYFVRDFT